MLPAGHRSSTRRSWRDIVARVTHGTALLSSSRRNHLKVNTIGEAARIIGFATPSDLVWVHPASREWHAAHPRDGRRGQHLPSRLAASRHRRARSRLEFHLKGRFDATITIDDGRSFAVRIQGLALQRRSLYDRNWALAEWDCSHRPGTVLILALNL